MMYNLIYLIGSFENAETELLSGKIYPYQNHQFFWIIFFSIVLSTTFIGSLALLLKRYFLYRANLDMIQNIHINLEDQNQIKNDNNVVNHQNFNNRSYNLPLLSFFETKIFFSLSVFMVALFVILPIIIDFKRTQIHQNIFYTEIIVEYVVGIAIPLYFLMKK